MLPDLVPAAAPLHVPDFGARFLRGKGEFFARFDVIFAKTTVHEGSPVGRTPNIEVIAYIVRSCYGVRSNET
jgi:hypothetical protein